jgi:hypothetical protein
VLVIDLWPRQPWIARVSIGGVVVAAGKGDEVMASELPTPARFRPLGPLMSGSPRIAS